MDSDRWPRTYRRCWLSSSRNQMHSADENNRIDAELYKQRQINAILNKLMPQNFRKLFAQLNQLGISSAGTLAGLVEQIFNRAIMEPTFCDMYALLCIQLSWALPEFPCEHGGHLPITFRTLLLNLCEQEFEEGSETEQDAAAEEESEEKQQRMLKNIRFLGELYKMKMLPVKIMHHCVQGLLRRRDADKKNVEAVCILLSKIGSMMDHSKSATIMDAYLQRLSQLLEKEDSNLSCRLRFMLKDLLDLRRNSWRPRHSQKKWEKKWKRPELELPKKIENMHPQFLFLFRSRSASEPRSKEFCSFCQPITVWAFGNALKEDTAGDFSIFVRDLSLDVTNAILYDSFATYRSISDAKVMRVRKTGRSRGFGFVSFRNRQDAESAIEEMNGKTLETRYKGVTRSANQGDVKQNSENGSNNASTNMDADDADQKNGSCDTHETI